jgi:hypothetical protein
MASQGLAIAQRSDKTEQILKTVAILGLFGACAVAENPLDKLVTFTDPKITTEKAVERVSQQTGLTIEIEVDELQKEGITKNQSFGIELKAARAGEAIELILLKGDPKGRLTYFVKEDGTIVITTIKAAKRPLASAADQPSDSPKPEPPAVKRDDREMQKKKEKEDLEMQKKMEMDARANGTWKGYPPRVRQRGDMKKVGPQDPAYLEMVEMMKNNGWWYGPDATEKLKAAAEAGDEWAIREIKWPEGHKFHKKGRPYFRNDGPHPKGLFPYTGLNP